MWLQQYMGYTATWAGMTTAWSGVLAVLCAPFAAILSSKIDSRALVFAGVSWLAGVTLWRAFGTSDMNYWQIALPLLVMGVGLPFFFVPVTGQALGSVEERETASAAGLMNFLRTLAGAFATSLATATWEDSIQSNHADLVAVMNPANQVDIAGTANASATQLGNLDQLVMGQSVILATNQIFLVIALILLVAACSIWLGPRASREVDASAAH